MRKIEIKMTMFTEIDDEGLVIAMATDALSEAIHPIRSYASDPDAPDYKPDGPRGPFDENGFILADMSVKLLFPEDVL